MQRTFMITLFAGALGAGVGRMFCESSMLPNLWAQEVAQTTKLVAERRGEASSNGLDAGDGLTPDERVNIEVYDEVNRGVVNITTQTLRPDVFFILPVPTEGAGSGSVLDKHGHILTNHHVVADAEEMNVTLFNGQSYDAKLIGQDPVNDIAVLKITAPPDTLHPIALGDSSRLRVGQKIYAVGNPFGLERTLTIGIVSSLNRTLPSRTGRMMKSIIQIDAALNQGNSGGPLLDTRARLIGMNTAIASSTGQNTGVGFAIPVNTVRRVIPELIEHGHVIRPEIGITHVDETDRGLVIAVLSKGGPAERGGLRGFRVVRRKRRRGPFVTTQTYIDQNYADMIIAIDGEQVRSADDLLTFVERKRPGDQIRVTIIRDGRQAYADVTLGQSE